MCNNEKDIAIFCLHILNFPYLLLITVFVYTNHFYFYHFCLDGNLKGTSLNCACSFKMGGRFKMMQTVLLMFTKCDLRSGMKTMTFLKRKLEWCFGEAIYTVWIYSPINDTTFDFSFYFNLIFYSLGYEHF